MSDAERPQCVAITAEGERCKAATNLSADGRCFWHDPARRAEAEKARSLAGRTTAKRARIFGGKSASARPSAVRVVQAASVPKLETLEDAVAVAEWLFRMGVSGQLDPATVREGNRSVATFKDAINKAHLQRRIRELEKVAKEYQKMLGTRS